MPSDRPRPATQKAWDPAPDRIIEEIGEDPARFLSPETSIDPWPRIWGIASREVAAAWLAVVRRRDYDDEYERALEAKIETMATQAQADGGVQERGSA